MKICQPHWDELRARIEKLGLSHLVAKNGEAALRRAEQEIEGKATDLTYDPLMACHWMITGEVLKLGGLYLLGMDESGKEYCPLCEVEKNAGVGAATNWIESCSDAVKEYCEEIGLVEKIGA